MPDEISYREFLKKSELYRPFKITEMELELLTAELDEAVNLPFGDNPDEVLHQRWPKKIGLHCFDCEREQPHAERNSPQETKSPPLRAEVINPVKAWDAQWDIPTVCLGTGTGLLFYGCTGCETTTTFAIHYNEDVFQLFGRWPNRRPSPADRVDGYLSDEQRELYCKALICKREGYGIAAAAYFRRIVENVLYDLLTDILEFGIAEDMDDIDDEEIERCLRQGKQVRGKEKYNIAVKILPEDTRIGGHNPLGGLYRTLSEDIHASTDEEACDRADEIQTVLDFVIEEIEHEKRRREKYGDALHSLTSGS